MLLEKRTRVEIFLPLKSNLENYQTVIDWLAEELAYARGGSTLTTPFTGLYTTTSQAGIIRDNVQVLFCDFNLDADSSDQFAELTSYLAGLRLMLIDVLHEEEVWIIYHSVTRIGGR